MEEDKFISKVILEILADNDHKIQEVLNIEIIKSIYFEKDEYLIVAQLLKDGKIELVKNFDTQQKEGFEFLDVVTFMDQDSRRFAATIYDSIELWQDPQVIEIFCLE